MDSFVPAPAHTLSPAKNWALFLDVDGTLLHLAATPDGVVRSPEIFGLLSRLSDRLGGAIALVSGRPVANLDHLFRPLRLPAAGLHGLEHRGVDGQLRLLGHVEVLDHLRGPLAALVASHPGLLLEDKGRALAVHYRQAPDLEARVRSSIEALVAGETDVRLIRGKMVFEIKLRHADKGSAIHDFMAEPPYRGRVPVFLGDDVTDEDGFRAVNALGGLSIHVGVAKATEARYELSDVDQVHDWLAVVAESLPAAGEGRLT